MQAWGYPEALLRRDFEFGQAAASRRVACAAFAHEPLDARTACIAIVEAGPDGAIDVAACRDLGAPVVFACHEDGVGWWKQGASSPELVQEVPADGLAAFLGEETRKGTFAPREIYRAKTQSRFEPQLKLQFVDELLMPSVERSIGERLGQVIDEVYESLAADVGAKRLTPDISHQLLRDTFWLLAAKILRDKQVGSFAQLDLHDVDEVFRRVRAHYGEPPQLLHRSPLLRAALLGAARRISGLSHLGQVTTEALAYVYETMLVTPELRRALGIHSTPPQLVEYILGRLTPWIEEMDWQARHVFEPACGHGAFLVAAMRRLREALPRGVDSHAYLQEHLRGLEVDPIAREIARLSLTLADIPNPDGWQLSPGDMFEGDALERHAREATILLANPPFEDFKPDELARYQRSGAPVTHLNRAEEMLWRTLPHLPEGAVLGVIMPGGALHSSGGEQLRGLLLQQFELGEVTLLPDKMFAFADVEAAVLIARKRRPAPSTGVRYRRVREPEIEDFCSTYVARSDREIPQEEFLGREGFDLRMPDLEAVWRRGEGATLEQLATIGQGFTYRRRDLPRGARTWAEKRFPGAVRGYLRVGRELQIHGQPAEVWMSLQREVILRPRSGTVVGEAQVIMNHHPVSRGPWRIKAVIDREGHAVSGRFLVVRPRSPEIPVELLWALCNSPYANVYAYTHASKRDIDAGVMRKMPVPRCDPGAVEQVAAAVRAYLDAMEGLERSALRLPREEERCRRLLLAVDALVLRLYDLPARLERELLDVLDEAGEHRAGVPLPWPRYFPAGFAPRVPLYVYESAVARRPSSPRPRKQAAGQAPAPEVIQVRPADGSPGGPEAPALTPRDVEEEIAMLYEELAGLDVLRAEHGATVELEARAGERSRRLRALQERQAQAISAAFRERFLMPPEDGPDMLERVSRLLEEYGDSPRPDPASDAAHRAKT